MESAWGGIPTAFVSTTSISHASKSSILRCPQCRLKFSYCGVLPDITQETTAWGRLISQADGGAPKKRDLSAALKAMLSLPPNIVENIVEVSWQQCAGGENCLQEETLKKFVLSVKHKISTMPIPQESLQQRVLNALCELFSCGGLSVSLKSRTSCGFGDDLWSQVTAGQYGNCIFIKSGANFTTIGPRF